jgi:photosystem II stability/assembly factor-like uncharacterized protein
MAGTTWETIEVTRETGEGLYGIWLSASAAITVGDRDFVGIATAPWAAIATPSQDRIVTSYQIRPRITYDGICFTDKNSGWIVGTSTYFDAGNQIVLHTNDGGQSWKTLYTRDTFCILYGKKFSRLRDISILDDGSGVAVGGIGSHSCDQLSSSIVFSNNALTSWQAAPFGHAYNCYSVFTRDPRHWWILPEIGSDSNMNLITTNNAGKSFNLINTHISASALGHGDIFFSDSLDGWVVGGTGVVARTIDGGATWFRQQDSMSSSSRPIAGQCYAVHFTTPAHGWIGGDSLYETGDSGNTWTSKNIGFGGQITSITFPSAQRGWAAGTNGVIMHTADGGKTWTNEDTPQQSYLRISAISFPNDSVGWACGASGLILKINPRLQPITGSVLTASPKGQKTIAFRMQQGKLIISLESGTTGSAVFSIVNLQGQMIRSTNASIVKGENVLALNTTGLGADACILRVKLGGKEIATRFSP